MKTISDIRRSFTQLWSEAMDKSFIQGVNFMTAQMQEEKVVGQDLRLQNIPNVRRFNHEHARLFHTQN